MGFGGWGRCVVLNGETPWLDLYFKTFFCILGEINHYIHDIVVDIWVEILHQLCK